MNGSKLAIGAMLLILVCTSALLFPQQMPGRGQQGPRITSPEILANKKVSFRLSTPKASAVVLNGSWDIGADIQMTKDEQGIWSVTVGPLGEQLWWYSFSVDGIKVLDPGNGEYSRDGIAGKILYPIEGVLRWEEERMRRAG
jgi:hypothetical protein